MPNTLSWKNSASEIENTRKCHRFPRLPESQYAMQRPTMSTQTMRRDTYTRSALSKTKDEVLPDTYASKHSAGTLLIKKGYFN